MRRAALLCALALPLFWSLPIGANAQMLDANQWNVSEDGGWTAVWTFDRDHKYMNGVWQNSQTGERVRVDGMRVRREGRQIVVTRQGLGNYVGTLSSDGTSMSGTLSWSSGRFSATIANGNDYNGGGRPGYGGGVPLLDAQSWSVSEDGGWNAVWSFNRDRRGMTGDWSNPSTGEQLRVRNLSVRRDGQQIIINRPGLGNYVGTLSNDGRSIAGTMSWSNARFRASIRS